jgi:hypothetical protein
VKLDPEERIIAAALDQAELDDANERGAGARIEFKREGHAKVTITISRELVDYLASRTSLFRIAARSRMSSSDRSRCCITADMGRDREGATRSRTSEPTLSGDRGNHLGTHNNRYQLQRRLPTVDVLCRNAGGPRGGTSDCGANN